MLCRYGHIALSQDDRASTSDWNLVPTNSTKSLLPAAAAEVEPDLNREHFALSGGRKLMISVNCRYRRNFELPSLCIRLESELFD